jgi:hypothetical protein
MFGRTSAATAAMLPVLGSLELEPHAAVSAGGNDGPVD